VTTSTTEGGSAAVQGRLWSARARDWAEVQEATLRPLFDAIADSLGIGAGTRVLDVGCGAGRFLRRAADRGADVAGLDAAAALVAIARERFPARPGSSGTAAGWPSPPGAGSTTARPRPTSARSGRCSHRHPRARRGPSRSPGPVRSRRSPAPPGSSP
jgi:hypothetical protein